MGVLIWLLFDFSDRNDFENEGKMMGVLKNFNNPQ